VAASAAPVQLADLRDPREVHFANVRQITFGGDNAEAYWSFSGKKLIFQSCLVDMKADQIFTINADGTDQKMVSTGKGRTTCSYFMKGDKEIIYASTHGADPEPPAPPDRSQGYVWGIFDTYAIYRAKADGSNLRPLFPKNAGPGVKTGYNAEATVSPDGKRIIFTSTKDGDLDLYTMKTDGTDVRRITHTLGYDGGAYFSPNSKMIVWRAGRPETEEEKSDYLRLLKMNLVRPSKLEIFVANADGSNPRQLTKNGKANFAPYFTPDGKRVIFASNMDDPRGRKFELYLIGLDGTGLERVTYGDQFDSFPMFSPNGKQIAWASNRHGKNNETNIFIADWRP
jgi:Tol biopolymer transport system component